MSGKYFMASCQARLIRQSIDLARSETPIRLVLQAAEALETRRGQRARSRQACSPWATTISVAKAGGEASPRSRGAHVLPGDWKGLANADERRASRRSFPPSKIRRAVRFWRPRSQRPGLANAASCSAESHDESTESEKESSAPTRSPPSTRAIADAAVSKSTSV